MLLRLPDECLLHILRTKPLHLDHSSICNAALAHSRLHKAAVAATESVQLRKYSKKGLQSLLLYMQRHRQYIRTVKLKGPQSKDPDHLMTLPSLPACTQLECLDLEQWMVQLGPCGVGLEALLAGQTSADGSRPQQQQQQQQQWWSDSDTDSTNDSDDGGDQTTSASSQNSAPDSPTSSGGSGSDSDSSSSSSSGQHCCQWLLQAAPALKQLRLLDCFVTDGSENLTKAAQQPGLLPGLTNLEHLDICWDKGALPPDVFVAGDTLSHLARLTHLTLSGPDPEKEYTDGGALSLVYISGFTGLRELALAAQPFKSITAAQLTGLENLTQLQLGSDARCPVYALEVEPAVLSCVPQLQHLVVHGADFPGEADGVAEFLSQLGKLTQLTHLALHETLMHDAPDAAYAALRASSRLQHLELCAVSIPAAFWKQQQQQQWPLLRTLAVSGHWRSWGVSAAEMASFASCCSGLQDLVLLNSYRSSDLMISTPVAVMLPLIALGPQLTRLVVCHIDITAVHEMLPRMEQLRALKIALPNSLSCVDLLQLKRLQQLDRLEVDIVLQRIGGRNITRSSEFECQRPGAFPCWQQLLTYCKNSSNSALRGAALQSLKLEALQQQLQELQQQLTSQQQECSTLQQEVSSLTEQLVQVSSRADRQAANMQAQFDALQQRVLPR